MLRKRATIWNAVSEDVKALPERRGTVGKALPSDLKRILFETAATNPDWMVAHGAAVLAVSTTCRAVELRNLRWQDVDLFDRVATIKKEQDRRRTPAQSRSTGCYGGFGKAPRASAGARM